MSHDIHLETTLPYPPALVWRALTESVLMSQWFMENDFVPRVGHRFQFRDKPQMGWDGVVNAEVTVVNEGAALAYVWTANASPTPTTVTWTLAPSGSGTKLTLDHTGFSGPRGMMIAHILGNGWKSALNKSLPNALKAL